MSAREVCIAERQLMLLTKDESTWFDVTQFTSIPVTHPCTASHYLYTLLYFILFPTLIRTQYTMVRASDVVLILVALLFPPISAAMITGCSCDLLINVVSV